MTDDVRPSGTAALVTGACLIIAGAIALTADLGEGFTPRVATVDALAGLAAGAFVVDRLLTFFPPLKVRKEPAERAADLSYLRVGYGALAAAFFVSLTDLRAVDALTPETASVTIGADWDRLVAMLAIAGGVAGIAQLLSGINPQPATDGTKSGDDPEPAAAANPPAEGDASKTKPIPPPDPEAYGLGAAGIAAAALLALFAFGDKTGLELLGTEPPPGTDGTGNADDAGTEAGGTVELVVRFGVVIVAAGIIEQIIERVVAPFLRKHNKALVTGAVGVVLGVAAAWILDLYLLHNIGFFGSDGKSINEALAASTDGERWGDMFLTGVIIAGGTKPLHDLGSRLRSAKPKDTGG